jgi:hypothetical protein
MKVTNRAITVTLGAAVAAIMFVPAAIACAPSTPQDSIALQQVQPDAQNPLALATPAALARDLSNASNQNSVSIVGMWNFQFISVGNTTRNPPIADGTVINLGYNQWHSDGTEIFNSAVRSPAQSNFCLGVWVKTGQSTYQLNHFALNYAAATGALIGRILVVEKVTLSPGGTQYSGTFTETVFDTNGNKTDYVVGQVTATRITVDTTTP